MFTPFPLVFALMGLLVASIPLDGVDDHPAIGGLSRSVGLSARRS